MDWNIITTVLLASLPQAAAFIWWASNQSTRLKQVEKDMSRLDSQVDSMGRLEIRVSVVESLLQTQTGVLREIRDEMRRSRTGD